MKRIIMLLGFIISAVYGYAQPTETLSVDTIDKRPFVTINGKEADPLSLLMIDRKQVLDIKILPKEESGSFGARAKKFGCVKVIMKKDAILLHLNDLLTRFGIKKPAYKFLLKISIPLTNGLNVLNPKLIMASENSVTSLSVIEKGLSKQLQVVILKIADDNKKETYIDNTFESLYKIFEEEAKQRKPEPNDVVIRG